MFIIAIELMVDTYCTIEQADKYHHDRGNAKWPKTPEIIPPTDPDGQEDPREHDQMIVRKENALRRSTTWLDGIARGKWKGVRVAAIQPLLWPRIGVVDEEGFNLDSGIIPELLSWATAEAAMRAFNGENLAPDQARGGMVKQQSVGNGAVSTTYMDNAPAEKYYAMINLLLKGLVSTPLFPTSTGASSSGSVRMVM